jgi:hypothetical protein
MSDRRSMYVRVSRVVCLDEGILIACEVVEFVRVEVAGGCGSQLGERLWWKCLRVVVCKSCLRCGWYVIYSVA